MSLTPILYASTDAGAPALTGQAGSLSALLDAVLVDGYGTGPSAKAGAGWTRAFSATNRRGYRNSAAYGSGRYLYVDDSASVGNARQAWVRAAEGMTDIDTLVNPAPTVAQKPSGHSWAKSSTLDATARPWVIIATERWFYLFPGINSTSVADAFPQFAGDLDTLKPGDAYHFMVSGPSLDTYTGTQTNGVSTMFMFSLTGFPSRTIPDYAYCNLLRSHTQTGASILCGFYTPSWGCNTSATVAGSSSSPMAYPSPITGGLIFDRMLIGENTNNSPRGYMPNMYAPMHDKPFTDLQQIVDVGGLPDDVTLLAKTFRAANNIQGQVLFDVTTESLGLAA